MYRLENTLVENVYKFSKNDLLKERALLIFEKLSVILVAMDIVACHRLEKKKRAIVKTS